MGEPTSIPPATVFRLLAHIAHPAEPIPPNLLSKPLLQRHHFLRLTPDTPAEYLIWPSTSADQSHVLHLLESQPLPSPEEHSSHSVALDTTYTADREHLHAHVRITPDLKIVFLWDDKERDWRYHNLATMPFPANAYANFRDAVAVYSPDDFLQEQDYEMKISGDADGDDDDAYWDAYGGGDDDAADRLPASKPAEDLNSEDAYWARYNSVQGSADSTIPSPLPIPKNPTSLPQSTDPSRIIVPSDDFSTHHVEPYNPLEPPSPEALSKRLEALSSAALEAEIANRASAATDPSTSTSLASHTRNPSSPPLFDDNDESPETSEGDSDRDTASPAAEVVPSVDVQGDRSEHTAPPPEDSRSPALAEEAEQRDGDGFVVLSPAAAFEARSRSAAQAEAEAGGEDPALQLVKDNVKNLYQIWRLGRSGTSSEEEDKRLFQENVRKALDAL